ncbi:inositol 2-dehydrogenase [Mesorhizobium sp. NZP2298]|uniref:inositol 2-dehydrogenase n=1 Tax=Mesorhizobium sp. NZP2298 TaxID=2483403 RepID=UPI001557D0A3|nr:inositol 2-dehydrogenase [Mesorhizobium sp. NZP2298]QKC93761.1 inositol 2-dehydrogenase [Mesorhizobium sp. NZP2298]
MKFSVFGAGRMGERHIVNLAASNRAELAYVVDPDLDRATALATKFGAKASTRPDGPLSDPAVDAVIISSATNTHVDLIIASAKAGKAVLCEKPIDLDMARVDHCAKAIKGCDVPIMIGFQRRFDPTHRAVHAAVAGGEVGKVEVISIVSRDPGPPPYSYIAVSGGQFHDQMIHDFDLALWLSGASGQTEVFAMGSTLVDTEIGRHGDTDTAQVLMRFENGAFCKIDCSRRAVYGYDQRVEVFGSLGLVSSGNLHRTAIERTTAAGVTAKDLLAPDFLARYLPTYALELDAFIDAVEKGTQPQPDFAAGRRALALADAARQSHREGRAVTASI